MHRNVVLFLILLISSCTIHKQGIFSSGSPNIKDRYEDIAFGYSQTTYIFGFGGNRSRALLYEAKKSMQLNRPLKKNERYINTTVDQNITFFLFVTRQRVVMTADVVSERQDTSEKRHSDLYLNKLSASAYDNALFSVGDTVYDSNGDKLQIVSFLNAKRVSVMNLQSKRPVLGSISINNIFTPSKSYDGFIPGKSRVVTKMDWKGVVKAVGFKKSLVEQDDKEVFIDKNENIFLVKE